MAVTHITSPEVRNKAAQTRQATKEAKAASMKFLEGGAKVYRDSPPGIGYVLEFPNRRKCYYMTSTQAEEMWHGKWAKDWAERPKAA